MNNSDSSPIGWLNEGAKRLGNFASKIVGQPWFISQELLAKDPFQEQSIQEMAFEANGELLEKLTSVKDQHSGVLKAATERRLSVQAQFNVVDRAATGPASPETFGILKSLGEKSWTDGRTLEFAAARTRDSWSEKAADTLLCGFCKSPNANESLLAHGAERMVETKNPALAVRFAEAFGGRKSARPDFLSAALKTAQKHCSPERTEGLAKAIIGHRDFPAEEKAEMDRLEMLTAEFGRDAFDGSGPEVAQNARDTYEYETSHSRPSPDFDR